MITHSELMRQLIETFEHMESASSDSMRAREAHHVAETLMRLWNSSSDPNGEAVRPGEFTVRSLGHTFLVAVRPSDSHGDDPQ